MNNPRQIQKHYRDQMREKGKSFYVYMVLRIIVIITAVRCLFEGNYESFSLCILSLILFLLPTLFQEKFKIFIPPAFEIIIYLFIFAAEILGEVNAFYTTIPGWDTMLHTLNGFLAAAIGFSMIDLLNRNSRSLNLTPFYQAMVAFCFSMTIGVVWEFFEFAMDRFFCLDMQKDFIVNTIASVTLDPAHAQNVIKVPDIVRTIIETADGGRVVVENGYLDIGILDTMKDLLVNFLGAIVFSILGYFYVKNEQKGTGKENIAGRMKLSVVDDDGPSRKTPVKSARPQSGKPQTVKRQTAKPEAGTGEKRQAPKKKVVKTADGEPVKKQAPKKKAVKPAEGEAVKQQAPKKKAVKPAEGEAVKQQAPKKKAVKPAEGEAVKQQAPKKKAVKPAEGEAVKKQVPKKKVVKTEDGQPVKRQAPKKQPEKTEEEQPREEIVLEAKPQSAEPEIVIEEIETEE